MKNSLESRVVLVCLAMVVGLSALSGKLIYLQWRENGDEDAVTAPGRSVKRTLVAQRGYLCDRNEEIIARNIPVTSIFADKKHLNDSSVVAVGVAYPRAVLHPEWADADERKRDRLVRNARNELIATETPAWIVEKHLAYLTAILAPHLGFANRSELKDKILNTPLQDVPLVKNLKEDVADQVEKAVIENRIQGLRFEKSYRRWYPNPTLAPHVVGIVSYYDPVTQKELPKGRGVSGVESSMSRYLEGKDGYEITKRDVRDLPLGKTSGVVKPPISGLIVQLTLDLGLQAIVEEELDAGLEFAEAKKGCIILMKPDTGEVLAMASRPAFDLNKRENVEEGGVNYATQAVYEPGSTFKIVSTAAALELGLADRNTPVFCHNRVMNEGRFSVRDYAAFGWLTLEQVLAKSSNIGAYQFAKLVGRSRYYEFVDKFGFGQRTGIALGGELPGLVNRKAWPAEFASMTYGYAVNVTPLQVANAYCAIANGGKLMRPMVVRAAMANDGTKICEFEPEVMNQPVSPRVAEEMRKALATVTEEGGTARKAAVPGFRVAGKTGTARKHKPGGYYDSRYVVSFAGMLPAENPEFVCVVVIDDPMTQEVSRGGGSLAAPVFAKVAGRVASAMNLKPTEPLISQELASE